MSRFSWLNFRLGALRNENNENKTQRNFPAIRYQEPIKGEGASNLAYTRGLRFVIAGETAIPYMGCD